MEDGGRVGGHKTCLIPQLDNYLITLNTLEIDLKTGRTNSTIKSREHATSKKVGSKEIRFGRNGSWSRQWKREERERGWRRTGEHIKI